MNAMTLRDLLDAAPIVFLGRYPTPEDRMDGYYQRVAAIDRLLEDLPRVYLRTDGPATMLSVSTRRADSQAWEVRISRRNPIQRRVAIQLAVASRGVYAHSVRALEGPIAWSCFTAAPRRVLDLHGAVPEEASMLGEASRTSALASLEGEALAQVGLLVGVSRRLLDHVVAKHRLESDPESLVLPIVTESADEGESGPRTGAIYAGGFQAWQQMEKMFDFIHRHPELPVTFLTPDPDRVQREYQERYRVDFLGTSESARPDELAGWYRAHRFGLILREDSIVNQVASPTKLAEYLGAGLIPIVDSSDIGDFPSMGYYTVRYDATLPTPEEARIIAAHNRAVFDELVQEYRSAAGMLRAWWVT